MSSYRGKDKAVSGGAPVAKVTKHARAAARGAAARGAAARGAAAHGAAAWEGHGRLRGERLREEMVVCFGADLPAARLIDGAFGPLATELYGPILAATVKP